MRRNTRLLFSLGNQGTCLCWSQAQAYIKAKTIMMMKTSGNGLDIRSRYIWNGWRNKKLPCKKNPDKMKQMKLV